MIARRAKTITHFTSLQGPGQGVASRAELSRGLRGLGRGQMFLWFVSY